MRRFHRTAMPTAIAYDKSTDTLIHVELEQFDAYDAGQVVRDRPKLVLFVPQLHDNKVHSHMRYHVSGGRMKTRRCCPTDVPAKVRAAFLLAN